MTRHVLEDRIMAGLRGGHVLPLLPRNRVYLFAPAGDGRRFAELFRRAWKRMPLWARRRILTHWKRGDASAMPREMVTASPQIELLGGWARRGQAMGAVWQNGHLLRFFSPIVHRMPDALVEDLIAHELAHVYQGARGELAGGEPDLLEENANEYMANWGFDAYAMDDWLLEQGELPGHLDVGAQ